MNISSDLAIVGIEGILGESFLAVLEDREFPFAKIHLLETEDAAGNRLMLRGQSQRVEVLERFDFSSVGLVIFAGAAETALNWAEQAVAAGAMVVDATGAYRASEAPLAVAEVNPDALKTIQHPCIVACPDAQAVQTAVALAPLVAAVGLESVSVATYQSMSTLGNEEVEALALQTGRLLNGQPAERGALEKQAAFNLIPRVGELLESGETNREQALAADVRRLLQMPELPISFTCVLVPTFFGTAAVVQARTARPVAKTKLAALMRKAPGIKLLDKPSAGGYPTPVTDATGTDQVWIGRLRQDPLDDQSVNMWIVSDNLRKGIALNSLLLAELLIKG
jgi:aspartate-semialdehyde dehydrogenase